jgi:hypothetical protein
VCSVQSPHRLPLSVSEKTVCPRCMYPRRRFCRLLVGDIDGMSHSYDSDASNSRGLPQGVLGGAFYSINN